MVRPLAVVAISLLTTTSVAVHLSARAIVEAGHGGVALVALFLALPLLARYLDD